MSDKKYFEYEQNHEYEHIRHQTTRHIEVFVNDIQTRNKHSHTDIELGLIMDGGCTIQMDNGEYSLKKGDIYIINRYEAHSINAYDYRVRILIFQINSNLCKDIDTEIANSVFPNKITSDMPEYQELKSTIIDCTNAYYNNARFHDLLCTSLALKILYILSVMDGVERISTKEMSKKSTGRIRASRMTDYIHEHYTEKVSLSAIAENEGLSVYYVSHLLKDVLGISFQDYVTNLRLEHAMYLVRNTDYSLIEICLESGFSNIVYMNTAFKKLLGFSASEYRESPESYVLPESKSPFSNMENRLSMEDASDAFKEYCENE